MCHCIIYASPSTFAFFLCGMWQKNTLQRTVDARTIGSCNQSEMNKANKNKGPLWDDFRHGKQSGNYKFNSCAIKLFERDMVYRHTGLACKSVIKFAITPGERGRGTYDKWNSWSTCRGKSILEPDTPLPHWWYEYRTSNRCLEWDKKRRK